ncbi:DUF2490 domain-containing protein [Algibacter lectus]|uniref:DUF2490 domain-containing protein n=1 Tax=Algibacter lectus TaxID=221126 RepID=UPI0026F34FF7|nr:DUF2490 domain-containing protein [Algibacter lectus]MDO7136854.1 DUF2490 domain-containing protein [Algibacter lectus]
MPHIKSLLLLTFIFINFEAFSQEHFSALGETTFGLNKKVSETYGINFTLRSRYFLYKDEQLKYNQQQIDLYHFSKLKLDKRHSLSLGTYYRTRDLFNSGSNELRFTQQFTYKKQSPNMRFSHRLRAEQRFLKNKTIFRERYRFSLNLPINNDTYFIGALEGLLSLTKQTTLELDERSTAQFGWLLSDTLKLQAGLEHRLETFNIEPQHYVFVLTTAVINI